MNSVKKACHEGVPTAVSDEQPQLTLFILTCAHTKEAEMISTALLEQQSVACTKIVPTKSRFLWNEAIDIADEVLLLMESKHELGPEIESTVRLFHRYETFVLMGIPLTYVSAKAQEWIENSVKAKFE